MVCCTLTSIVPYSEDVYSSMAFVFDTTGSMQDDYIQLRSHAQQIMDYVLKRNDTNIKHFVLVPFNDPVVGPASESFDPLVIMHMLNKINVVGGGDCPEMGVTAIIQALEIVKPNSYIYVFTDASAKDDKYINQALDLIQRKQVQVVVLQTGHCSSMTRSYQSIASMGSGQVFDVSKNDVSQVLEFIKTSMDTNRVNLLSINVPHSEVFPSPKAINVDDSIKQLLVSVSGLKTMVNVVNPTGKKMDESDGLMTDLDLQNVKIMTILDPMPGEWTLYVTSESAHTIRACGTSTKSFDYGFAITKPGSISQTSHRPMKGTSNYVLVKYPDVNAFLSCDIKELHSDGKNNSLPIFEISKNVMLCGPFVPNNNPFYVQVFGKNNNGNYFKRITKTSITPDDPDKPYISTPKRVVVEKGEELHIVCHVESLVPFSVTWRAFNYPAQNWNFNQSAEIELVIRNVTLSHIGMYECSAKNIAGNSESLTNVNVIAKPTLDRTTENVTVILFEGDNYSIACEGHGLPEPKIAWISNGTPIPPYSDHVFIVSGTTRLVIYDATFDESNVYICRASNDFGVSEKHYQIIVRTKPSLSTANETLEIDEFSDVYLRCPLPNKHNRWFKDNVDISSIINERADEPHYKQTDHGLKIYELNAEDSATYACVTPENKTYTHDLNVVFSPHFVVESPDQILAKINDTILLDCTVKGYPIPKVLWTKNDMLYPVTEWTLKNSNFLNGNQQIVIKSVDLTHGGTYNCNAKHKFGIERRTLSMTVL
ncbi:hemicentin-1-like isoform X2 [Adelges cooleyi]|nr:hemicentin-1-like isoform X2 [Adelges cooleyi]